MEVGLFDRSNLNGIYGYLKLAIPALLSEVVEWIAYDVVTIMAGMSDDSTLGCYVIFDQILKLWSTIPLGITYATITLVGNKIGEGRVEAA